MYVHNVPFKKLSYHLIQFLLSFDTVSPWLTSDDKIWLKSLDKHMFNK